MEFVVTLIIPFVFDLMVFCVALFSLAQFPFVVALLTCVLVVRETRPCGPVVGFKLQ